MPRNIDSASPECAAPHASQASVQSPVTSDKSPVRDREADRKHEHDGSDCEKEEQERSDPKVIKRRRISRACDDCRRKKIKCDGKQPCSSCAEFNSACTYHTPQRRNKPSRPLSREPKDLEARLHVAESLIRRFLPQIDLQSLTSPKPTSSRQVSPGQEPCDGASDSDGLPNADTLAEPDKYIQLAENEDHLQYTEGGEFDFYGTSSGAALMSRITRHFPELLQYDSRIPFLPQAPPQFTSANHGASHSTYNYAKLPPRELARSLCEYSFNQAACLIRIVHVPSFYEKLDALYNAERQTHSAEDGRYAGLLYSILALGAMYDVDENDPSNPDHYFEAMNRGYKFYLGARFYLGDLTECRDMTSLQALLFIIQFLQALGNLNSCYNLIGVALRTALRMGLHRHLPNLHMTQIDRETRKRVFHTIRQMDIYLSTTLGLPVVLHSRDIEQPLPLPIDDAEITQDVTPLAVIGTSPVIQAFNCHVRLMEILAMVVERVYPSRAFSRQSNQATYRIDCGELRKVETKLHDWYNKLPTILHPGQEEDVNLMRIQILLRFAYAHVQMMLYRPFMQFFNQQIANENPKDHRHQEFAAAGINVCRNIISIGFEIRKQDALIGSYWFIMYTQFLAVLCLVHNVSQNADKPEALNILSDAVLGKDSMSSLAKRSLVADRLSGALESVFEQLPRRLSSKLRSPNADPSDHGARHQSNAPTTTGSPFQTYGTGNLNSHRTPHPPQHWYFPDTSNPTLPGLDTSLPANQSGVPTHGPSGVATPLDLIAPTTDRVMFPIGDPVAYPSTATWHNMDDSTASMSEDTMQLIIPDMEGGIMGQPSQPSELPSITNTASNLFSFGRGGFLDDPIANIFNDLEAGSLPAHHASNFDIGRLMRK